VAGGSTKDDNRSIRTCGPILPRQRRVIV
jgi:hypothetical protein